MKIGEHQVPHRDSLQAGLCACGSQQTRRSFPVEGVARPSVNVCECEIKEPILTYQVFRNELCRQDFVLW